MYGMGFEDEAPPAIGTAALESVRGLWWLFTRGGAALAAIAAWHWLMN